MSKVTAIDLGSNSFRVLVYDYIKEQVIHEYNEIVATADGLVHTGIISDDATQRVINAITKSSNKLDYDPKECICVTTAAMRMAKNSDAVLKKILQYTGVDLKIIDAKEEARLTFLAINHALKRESIQSDKFILLDIGGGSIELTIYSSQKYVTRSFNFGIVTLAQNLDNDINAVIKFLDKQKKVIRDHIDTLNIVLEDFEYIATAGTPTTVAAIKHGQNFLNYEKSIINGTKVELNDVNTCLDLLRKSSEEEILTTFGKNDIYLTEVGIVIYKSFFEILNKRTSIVFDDGLKEGVAINYANKMLNK